MAKRAVLAYSGGLDTSVAVAWLKEELGIEVIAVAVDVGQGGDLDAVKTRALEAGAIDAVVIDGKKRYANEILLPALYANALYEGKYPLVSSLSRPLIVDLLVKEARKYGADSLAHGCTGKGNDQVRFEVATRALAPDLEILAPVRSWGMTREESIEYAKKHGVKVPVTKNRLYSIDENIWGRAIECGILEDPWNSPPDDVWEMTSVKETPPTSLTLGFEKGVPVSLDGKEMDFLT
ncbi:MAG: argininosuccinate synthase, partial [Acidimicrobiales bacterium]|nr:argininosuccinate synthase [Acidimicrobiales bacterium]